MFLCVKKKSRFYLFHVPMQGNKDSLQGNKDSLQGNKGSL